MGEGEGVGESMNGVTDGRESHVKWMMREGKVEWREIDLGRKKGGRVNCNALYLVMTMRIENTIHLATTNLSHENKQST